MNPFSPPSFLPGDHFLPVIEDLGLMVYGQVLDPEDITLVRRLSDDSPNARVVRGFSELAPQGEVGVMLTCHMRPLSRQAFEQARQNGWPSDYGRARRCC